MARSSIRNNLSEDDIFIVGYGGWVKVKRYERGEHYENLQHESNGYIKGLSRQGTILQVTGASVSRQTNLPLINSYYLPYHDRNNESAKSPMLLGKGTYTFTGDISFELTYGSLREFLNSDFFERDVIFSMSFFDGQNTCVVTNCVWSSFQIQCAPNSLVTVSMSYQSNNGYVDDLQIFQNEDTDMTLVYDENDLLVPYWSCGYEGFQEFSIGFERPVTPIFLNGDLHTASYLRPGLVGVNLSATTIEYIEDWDEELDIAIGNEARAGTQFTGHHGIVLLKSVLQACQYNMSSMTDTGAKTYTWNSISENAHERIFRIY